MMERASLICLKISVKYSSKSFPGGASGREPKCQCRRHEIQVQSLGWEGPLEEGMATHSSIFAWENPMDRGA